MLALLLEPLIAAKAKANQACGQGGVLLPQKSAEAVETRKEIAKAANVSHDTVAKVKIINKANEAGKGVDSSREGRSEETTRAKAC